MTASSSAYPVEFSGVARSVPAPNRRSGKRAQGGRAGETSTPTTRTVLREVSLRIRPGEVVAILGPSGCGKSTLLRIAGGLDAPTGGAALIDGTAVTGFDARCAHASGDRTRPTVGSGPALASPAAICATPGGGRAPYVRPRLWRRSDRDSS